MSHKVEILNPSSIPNWDTQVQSFPGYTFFHSCVWAKVLEESYGYTPLYFCATENGRLQAVIPMMEVNSFLTGRKGVALPFSDYCEPLADNPAVLLELSNQIINYGSSREWKYVEIRGGNEYLGERQPSCNFFRHVLPLSGHEEKVLSSFRKGTKSAITKAIRENQLQLRTTQEEEGVKEFFRLNCITRQRHGIPPQPYSYFKKLHDLVISQGVGFTILASYEGKVIASGIFLHFGKYAVYKYGAADYKYQQLRPNNLVVWEAIKWYCRQGYSHFDFGRTEPENEGLRIFKSGWNTEETTVNYFKYDIKAKAYVKDTPAVNPIFTKMFNRMPIPALTFIGRVLYRHMG